MLGVLGQRPAAAEFDKLTGEMTEKAQALVEAKQKTVGWKEPLSPDDTLSRTRVCAVAEASKIASCDICNPRIGGLRKHCKPGMISRRHTVPPTWSKILGELAAMHRARGGIQHTWRQSRWERMEK